MTLDKPEPSAAMLEKAAKANQHPMCGIVGAIGYCDGCKRIALALTESEAARASAEKERDQAYADKNLALGLVAEITRQREALYKFVERLGKWPVKTNPPIKDLFDVARLARTLIDEIDAARSLPSSPATPMERLKEAHAREAEFMEAPATPETEKA